ncbi:MAG: magnesium transporter [Clostridiales bacterium]|jgi:magnesium transporter|nr:magnesium transporter [Clostridiales bacterium]
MTEDFKNLLASGQYDALAEKLEQAASLEAALFLAELSEETLAVLCPLLESDKLADILVEAPAGVQERIISSLRDRDLKEVMDEVSVEDTIEIIEDLPDNTAVLRRIAETDEILQLAEEKKYAVLKPLLSQMNPTDLAQVFEHLPESDVAVVFRILPKELAAEIFVEMPGDLKMFLIASLNDIELKAIMDELFLDDTVDLIEEMPANVVKRIIAQSDHETRGYINQLLNYPKNSAGTIMTIEFVSLKAYMTVKQAFEKIRKTGIDKETIYTCYVTDEKNKLIGIVTAKNLMLESMDALIGDIMEENIIYADTHTDQEKVAHLIEKYGFLALPIVDREQRLVGIVTVDDAMTILQKEATEDMAIMGAVTPSSRPYLKTSVFRLWLNRVPWLLLLMVSATFTGLIITHNEAVLQKSAFGLMLMACIPMLMDTGGNAGSQASVTVIRGIALNEIGIKDILKVTWKEVRVSVLLGLTLAVACFGKLMAIDMFWAKDGGFLTAFVVCLTMFITIVMAKVVGSVLPLVAKLLRLDPAVVAAPFITTIVDALSLIVYCGLAILILGI